jgi:hypothetical protein
MHLFGGYYDEDYEDGPKQVTVTINIYNAKKGAVRRAVGVNTSERRALIDAKKAGKFQRGESVEIDGNSTPEVVFAGWHLWKYSDKSLPGTNKTFTKVGHFNFWGRRKPKAVPLYGQDGAFFIRHRGKRQPIDRNPRLGTDNPAYKPFPKSLSAATAALATECAEVTERSVQKFFGPFYKKAAEQGFASQQSPLVPTVYTPTRRDRLVLWWARFKYLFFPSYWAVKYLAWRKGPAARARRLLEEKEFEDALRNDR